jgi:4-hydroxybenzoate polyprenyltransferase
MNTTTEKKEPKGSLFFFCSKILFFCVCLYETKNILLIFYVCVCVCVYEIFLKTFFYAKPIDLANFNSFNNALA